MTRNWQENGEWKRMCKLTIFPYLAKRHFKCITGSTCVWEKKFEYCVGGEGEKERERGGFWYY